MVRYGLILGLDKAVRLRIISNPILTPKGAIKGPEIRTTVRATFAKRTSGTFDRTFASAPAMGCNERDAEVD